MRLIAASAAVCALLALAACTTSNTLMTGQARAAVPVESVRILTRAPAEYESIAILSATSTASTSRDGSRMKAIEELRAKAAALGANGLLLAGFSSDGGGGVVVPAGRVGVLVATPGVMAEVQAEAIWFRQTQ